MLLTASARLGVAPSECVVVEDSVPGCIAAKAASMRVIAVPDGHVASDPRYAVADLVLGSLEELGAGAALAVMGLDPGAG